MRNWPWIAALAVVCYLGGMLSSWPLLENVAYALAALLILGFAVVLAARHRLEASYSTDRTRVNAGEEIEETFHFRKGGPFPALWVEIHEDELDHDEVLSASLWAGSSRDIKRTALMPARGRYELGRASVYVRDPFGLFAVRHARLAPQTVTVYPRPLETPDSVRAASMSASSQHRWRLESADATLGDLREYVEGDPPSRIHWRSTARTGTIMVTEPETQRRRAIWLLVDLGGSPSACEAAAGIGAYLAERLWQTDQEVGALVAGRNLATVPSQRGREHVSRVLEPLATVTSAGQTQVERLARAASRCPNPGSLVLISPTSDPRHYLQRLRRICPNVVFVRAEAQAVP